MTRIMLTITDMTALMPEDPDSRAIYTSTISTDDTDELVHDIGREAERLAEKIIKGQRYELTDEDIGGDVFGPEDVYP